MASELERKQDELDGMIDRGRAFQRRLMKDDAPLSQREMREFDRLMEATERLSVEVRSLETEEKLRRTPADPVVPLGEQPDEGEGGSELTTTPGELFVVSDEYRAFIRAGLPKGPSSTARVPGPLDQRVVVRGTLRRRLDTKAVPVLAPGVIQPMRDPDAVRIPGRDPSALTIRDVLNVQRTTSNTIEYLTYSFAGEPAAIVAEGGLKPQNDAQFDLARAVVEVIAKWIPVTNQMVEDSAMLAATINDELIYEIRYAEAKAILWTFPGLLDPAVSVPVIPTPADSRAPENVIDAVRMGITDVVSRGGTPTAVVMHPLDWEAAQLLKTTDGAYLWVVVTQAGVRQFWGLPVIQSSLMENPSVPGERWLLVGDFIRGATLYVRSEAGIALGWIDDQFIRNMRSILAEERAAFAVKRPHFFAKYQTAPVAA